MRSLSQKLSKQGAIIFKLNRIWQNGHLLHGDRIASTNWLNLKAYNNDYTSAGLSGWHRCFLLQANFGVIRIRYLIPGRFPISLPLHLNGFSVGFRPTMGWLVDSRELYMRTQTGHGRTNVPDRWKECTRVLQVISGYDRRGRIEPKYSEGRVTDKLYSKFLKKDGWCGSRLGVL